MHVSGSLLTAINNFPFIKRNAATACCASSPSRYSRRSAWHHGLNKLTLMGRCDDNNHRICARFMPLYGQKKKRVAPRLAQPNQYVNAVRVAYVLPYAWVMAPVNAAEPQSANVWQYNGNGVRLAASILIDGTRTTKRQTLKSTNTKTAAEANRKIQ